jgi:CO/xanthine dehydrogenase FAD-binding subunit
MLPEFDLLMPQALPEALDMLAQAAPEVLPLAGGTNLIVDMRSGRRRPNVLVNVAGLDELRGIRQENGHMIVGGGTTITELMADPLIARYGAPLPDAAAVLASPLVRNRATIAGNLVDASPAADTAPPLLVLNAEVELTSQVQTRRVPLEDFLVGVRQTLRQPDELLTAIRWPIPPPSSAAAFYKVGLRKADAIAVVSVAVMVEYDDAGRCQQARIALGSVAPRVIRTHAAEDSLQDQRLTDETIAAAARLSAEATRPIDDVRGSADYRRWVAQVLVQRLLAEVDRNRALGKKPVS